jgi:hypothetical protein
VDVIPGGHAMHASVIVADATRHEARVLAGSA